MNDIFYSLFIGLVRAIQGGSRRTRIAAIAGVLAIGLGLTVIFGSRYFYYYPNTGQVIGIFFVGLGAVVALTLSTLERLRDEERSQAKIERVEDQVRQHPEKPQLAWDLARTKLESYLDRNLAQLQSIFYLTVLVMIAGFAFILYGLIEAYASPANFPVSVIGAASGVIVSFVGGSFLLVYRSILSQTRTYVAVLERINAVGMAVQVLGTIADDAKDLKNDATASLAKQLIEIYAKKDSTVQ